MSFGHPDGDGIKSGGCLQDVRDLPVSHRYWSFDGGE